MPYVIGSVVHPFILPSLLQFKHCVVPHDAALLPSYQLPAWTSVVGIAPCVGLRFGTFSRHVVGEIMGQVGLIGRWPAGHSFAATSTKGREDLVLGGKHLLVREESGQHLKTILLQAQNCGALPLKNLRDDSGAPLPGSNARASLDFPELVFAVVSKIERHDACVHNKVLRDDFFESAAHGARHHSMLETEKREALQQRLVGHTRHPPAPSRSWMGRAHFNTYTSLVRGFERRPQ
mmetsp:Transcript_48602/g.92962  ORF Transcript_48602/g.92962 Transcript_48602/m.92962 type:complete len:235 (-) Transcript_48602:738-1442(-)